LTCASDARYEKLPGYDPLLCFIAETKMVLRGLFRPGNASPSGNALSFLRGSLKRLPPWVADIRIRSDSAWYNHQVMDFCHDHGIRFTTVEGLAMEPPMNADGRRYGSELGMPIGVNRRASAVSFRAS